MYDILARLRNNNATDDDNVDIIFFKKVYIQSSENKCSAVDLSVKSCQMI